VFSELRWEVIVCYVDIDGIDDHYCLNILFVFSELRWEVIVCFVDISGIDDHYCLNFLFVFSELRWKVIVCFVDIDGIDDNYCLSFLFCVKWVKMRGDCLFCWYWWKQTITSYLTSLNKQESLNSKWSSIPPIST
jgi:hypothetical protein